MTTCLRPDSIRFPATAHEAPILISSRAPGCRCPDRCYNFRQTAALEGVDMLDAYIIERIRREQESRRDGRRPVLEMPTHRPPPDNAGRRPDRKRPEDRPPRGVAIIDFSI